MDKCLTYAIILAAGDGKRMQAGKNKMQIEIEGRSILDIVLERFQNSDDIDRILVVVSENEMLDDTFQPKSSSLKEKYPKIQRFIIGGSSRQESVYHALLALESESLNIEDRIIVLIHDGARCFVPKDVIERVVKALKSERRAVAAAMPLTDTIRQIDSSVVSDLPVSRDQLLSMQTPQGADLDILLKAFELAESEGIDATDDLALLIRIGYPVAIVPGDRRNMKLTTMEDMEIASHLYKADYFQ